MNALTVFGLILAGLIVAARARLNAVLFGQPVSIPWLGIAAAFMILTLVTVVLYLAWLIARERPPRPAYRPVYVVTDLH
jgi:ABC-type Mn2+/Zn2+ transport system permease subunit